MGRLWQSIGFVSRHRGSRGFLSSARPELAGDLLAFVAEQWGVCVRETTEEIVIACIGVEDAELLDMTPWTPCRRMSRTL